jgi:hypothetical protein
MKAVSYEAKQKLAVSSHLKPKLKAPTDAGAWVLDYRFSK